MLAPTETIDLELLGDICRTYHVRHLSVFGSFARGEQRPDGDVDLLVEYETGFTPSFFRVVELSEKLRPVFGGRDVDLVIPADLHWFIRDQVLNSAQTIYEG
jgi:predicted nucleotidyltransferase